MRDLLPRNPNAFTRSPLDRVTHLRRDAAYLQKQIDDDQARVVIFHGERVLLFESGPGLFIRYLAGHVHAELGSGGPLIFLGHDYGESPVFACEIADPNAVADYGRFSDLRGAAPRLEAKELPIIGTAKAILEWHAKNQFCANCGVRSAVAEAGWKRVCPACAREHFPRVDPVCIMLPVLGERCLLGRQAMWPRGMHSALAGFIEPGETIEEAVARETLEEVGLVVREVELHSTQPWPFPHSLMIGALCTVETDSVKVDEAELESARWFTRDEARALIAGAYEGAFCPPPFAIAHQLLKSWAVR